VTPGQGVKVAGGPVQVPRRILIVDDDPLFRNALARDFRNRGCDVQTASNLEEAVGAAMQLAPDLAIVDLQLDDKSGFEVLERLRTEVPEVRVVMLTGYGTIPLAVQAVRLGATHFLTKPLMAEKILEAVHPTMPRPRSAVSLARVEWEHIRRTVDACDGNVSEAARLLRIHRRSLQRKLRKRPPDT
jgi:two-component system response regulator RegA